MLNGDYGTHLPLLVQAVSKQQTGLVVELGCGVFSTPILHALCRQAGLMLYSLETDPEWCRQFTHLAWQGHLFPELPAISKQAPQILWEPVWRQALATLGQTPLGVVFVDQAPAAARIWTMQQLRERTAVFVVHDTECQRDYEYEPTLSSFRYRKDYKRLTPWTSLVSDTVSFSDWEDL